MTEHKIRSQPAVRIASHFVGLIFPGIGTFGHGH